MTDPQDCTLSVHKQCGLLGIHRSGAYYVHKQESAFNLMLMDKTHRWMLDDPSRGSVAWKCLNGESKNIAGPKSSIPIKGPVYVQRMGIKTKRGPYQNQYGWERKSYR